MPRWWIPWFWWPYQYGATAKLSSITFKDITLIHGWSSLSVCLNLQCMSCDKILSLNSHSNYIKLDFSFYQKIKKLLCNKCLLLCQHFCITSKYLPVLKLSYWNPNSMQQTDSLLTFFLLSNKFQCDIRDVIFTILCDMQHQKLGITCEKYMLTI